MGDPELPGPLLTPAAFLLDLDGTLYTDRGAVPGGPATIAALRARGIPFRCVTNTTTRSRAGLSVKLGELGYDIGPEEILTPVVAASAYCRARGIRRVAAYAPAASLEDLEGVEVVAAEGVSGAKGRAGESPSAQTAVDRVDAIVVGDLGEAWDFSRLQSAFSRLKAGAAFIALSRDRYFLKDGELTLDAGAFVAGLEYASGVEAVVVGKPSAAFYGAAIEALNAVQARASNPAGKPTAPPLDPRLIAMVGDDLWSDVQGAQLAGMQGWLVRTGKFREETLAQGDIRPDRMIPGIAALSDFVS